MIFLLKYWKYLAGAIAFIFLIYGTFLYGKLHERRKWEVEILKEVIKRKEAEQKVIEKGHDVINRFRDTKGKPLTPEKTEYYECLLSDNPLDC